MAVWPNAEAALPFAVALLPNAVVLLLVAAADVPMAKAWSFEAFEFRPMAIMSVWAEFALDATALCPTAMVSLLVDFAVFPTAMPL
ncbi:hypothetical protein D9M68_523090 [compost metagenome]